MEKNQQFRNVVWFAKLITWLIVAFRCTNQPKTILFIVKSKFQLMCTVLYWQWFNENCSIHNYYLLSNIINYWLLIILQINHSCLSLQDMEVRDKVIGRLSMEKLEKKPNLKVCLLAKKERYKREISIYMFKKERLHHGQRSKTMLNSRNKTLIIKIEWYKSNQKSGLNCFCATSGTVTLLI